MPVERLSMRKVREVLRLKHALGMSYRAISEATGIGKTAAAEYVHRAAVIGVTWPVPEVMSDAELELGLFPVGGSGSAAWRAAIDWPAVRKRPTNDRRTRRRFSLDGRRLGQRRYRVGFIAAGATFQGSSASTSARVVACGNFSKIKRRYA